MIGMLEMAIQKVKYTVRKFRIVQGVGDHDYCSSFPIELGEEVHYLESIFSVQVSRRFVCQQRIRTATDIT